jgi:ABC-type sugar transport system ATPase subunit
MRRACSGRRDIANALAEQKKLHVYASMKESLIGRLKARFYLPPENRNFGMVFQAFAVWPHANNFLKM